MSTLTLSINSDLIIDAVKKRYVEDFGSMDERAYFMAGFLDAVFRELNKGKIVNNTSFDGENFCNEMHISNVPKIIT